MSIAALNQPLDDRQAARERTGPFGRWRWIALLVWAAIFAPAFLAIVFGSASQGATLLILAEFVIVGGLILLMPRVTPLAWTQAISHEAWRCLDDHDGSGFLDALSRDGFVEAVIPKLFAGIVLQVLLMGLLYGFGRHHLASPIDTMAEAVGWGLALYFGSSITACAALLGTLLTSGRFNGEK